MRNTVGTSKYEYDVVNFNSGRAKNGMATKTMYGAARRNPPINDNMTTPFLYVYLPHSQPNMTMMITT